MVAFLSSFIVEIEDHEDILHYTNNLYGSDNQQNVTNIIVICTRHTKLSHVFFPFLLVDEQS